MLMRVKIIMFQILVHVLVKLMNDILIMIYDEILDAVAKLDTMSINLNDEEATCKMNNYYILLAAFMKYNNRHPSNLI